MAKAAKEAREAREEKVDLVKVVVVAKGLGRTLEPRNEARNAECYGCFESLKVLVDLRVHLRFSRLSFN